VSGQPLAYGRLRLKGYFSCGGPDMAPALPQSADNP
jgi:hypothetical protein